MPPHSAMLVEPAHYQRCGLTSKRVSGGGVCDAVGRHLQEWRAFCEGDARRGNHLADEPILKPHAHTAAVRARANREVLSLVGVALAVVAVVLALMLFGGFGSATVRGGGSTNRGKKIVPVEGLNAAPGVVSAWVAQGGDLSAVLRVAGLENSTITDLGGGRYVISVPAGTEDTVVRILADVDGVYDAGRVYSSNK